MNIFALDNDPVLAAQALCDTHSHRMVLECAQLLCNAFEKAPYKRTHYTVGVALWTRATEANWRWLLAHGQEAAREYTLRYGKVHKSAAVINWCAEHFRPGQLPASELTPFYQSTKDMVPQLPDPVEAYRRFYVLDKARFARWNRGRPPPAWWPK